MGVTRLGLLGLPRGVFAAVSSTGSDLAAELAGLSILDADPSVGGTTFEAAAELFARAILDASLYVPVSVAGSTGGPRRWRVEIWDDLEAAGGVRKAAITPLLTGTVRRSLDNSDMVDVTAGRSTEWAQHVTLRSVIRTVDHVGTVLEWRVSEFAEERGEQQSIARVVGISPLTDLGLAGLIVHPSTDGQLFYNLGGKEMGGAQYLETFAIPALSRHGVNYVAVGTVDGTERIDVAWDRWSPLQLAQELRSRTNTDLEYLRSGSTGYTLNLRTERGSSAPTVLFRVGRNLSILRRRQRMDDVRNVLIPSGQVVPGAVEAATIAHAAWRVDVVTGGTSGGSITLVDPSSGDGPVGFNDQLTGLWLLKTDATLAAISSASTGQVLVLDNAGAISTGDHVEIRASSGGAHLTELTNPASTASLGRMVAAMDDSQYRGERNHVRNGLWSEWKGLPIVLGVQPSSAQTSVNQFSVSGLPTTAEIRVGDAVHINTLATGDTRNIWRITANATASGTGTAVLIVSSSALTTLSTSDHMRIYQQGSSRAPFGWTYDPLESRGALFQRRSATATSTDNLSGQSNGANNTSTAGVPRFLIRGLSANAEIYAGDVLLLDTSSARFRILGNAVATSSGDVTVVVHGAALSTDGAPLTIERPTLTADAGTFYGVLQTQTAGAAYIQSEPYTFRYDSTLPMLQVGVGVTYDALSAVSSSQTAGFPLRVEVVNTDTSTIMATITDASYTLPARSLTDVPLRTSVQLTSDTTIAIRIYPPSFGAGQGSPEPFVYPRYAMLALGPDPSVPPVEGSHANRLWQRSNSRLASVSEDPDTFEIRVRDLSAVLGSTAESLTVGGSVRLLEPSLGLDRTLRIAETRQNILDPANDVDVVLSRRPRKLTDILAQQRRQSRLFVSIDVAGTTSTSGGAGAGTGVPISSDPDVRTAVSQVSLGSPNELPTEQRGAYRANGSRFPGSTGTITLNPI